MKKTLTIYIDDDTELKRYLATFVVYRGEESSVTMQNGVIPEGANALYLPWKNKTREAMFFTELSNEK